MPPRSEKTSAPLEKYPCTFQAQEQHLTDILNSSSPFQLLSKVVREHIPERTTYETYTGLHQQAKAHPDNPEARLEFLWLTLPSVLRAASRYRHLGIEDSELLALSLEITQNTINKWIPQTGHPPPTPRLSESSN